MHIHKDVTFDENTLFKVYDSLRAAGLDETQARDCITEMQNKGLLFRERVVEPEYKGPTYRSSTTPRSLSISNDPKPFS